MDSNFHKQVLLTDQVYPTTHQQDYLLPLPYGFLLYPFKSKNETYNFSPQYQCVHCCNYVNRYSTANPKGEIMCNFCNTKLMIKNFQPIENNIYILKNSQQSELKAIKNIFFAIDTTSPNSKNAFIKIVESVKFQFDYLLQNRENKHNKVIINIIFIFFDQLAHILQMQQSKLNLNSTKFEFKMLSSNLTSCELVQLFIDYPEFCQQQIYYETVINESINQQIQQQEYFLKQQQTDSITYNQQIFSLLFELVHNEQELESLFDYLSDQANQQQTEGNQRSNRFIFQTCLMLQQFDQIIKFHDQLNANYDEIHNINFVIGFGGDSAMDPGRCDFSNLSEQQQLEQVFPDMYYYKQYMQLQQYLNQYLIQKGYEANGKQLLQSIFNIYFQSSDFIDLSTFSLFTPNNQGTIQVYENENRKFLLDLEERINLTLNSYGNIILTFYSQRYKFTIPQLHEMEPQKCQSRGKADITTNSSATALLKSSKEVFSSVKLSASQASISSDNVYIKQQYYTNYGDQNFKCGVNMQVKQQTSNQQDDTIQIVIQYKSFASNEEYLQIFTFSLKAAQQTSQLLIQIIPKNKTILCLINNSNECIPNITKFDTKNICFDGGCQQQKAKFSTQLEQYCRKFILQFKDLSNVNFTQFLHYSYSIINSEIFKNNENVFIDDKIFMIFRLKQLNQDNLRFVVNCVKPIILVCPLSTKHLNFYIGYPDVDIMYKDSEYSKINNINKHSCCILLNSVQTTIVCIIDDMEPDQNQLLLTSGNLDISSGQQANREVMKSSRYSVQNAQFNKRKSQQARGSLSDTIDSSAVENSFYVENNSVQTFSFQQNQIDYTFSDSSNSGPYNTQEYECSDSNDNKSLLKDMQQRVYQNQCVQECLDISNGSASLDLPATANYEQPLTKSFSQRVLQQGNVTSAIMYLRRKFHVDDDLITILQTSLENDQVLIHDLMFNQKVEIYVQNLLKQCKQ